jgi:hypothetical protein
VVAIHLCLKPTKAILALQTGQRVGGIYSWGRKEWVAERAGGVTSKGSGASNSFPLPRTLGISMLNQQASLCVPCHLPTRMGILSLVFPQRYTIKDATKREHRPISL